MGALAVVTGPTVEPITLPQVRAQLRISHTLDDSQLQAMMLEAREWAQGYTRRTLATTTYDYYLHVFPSKIHLPTGPVQSITSIKYYDLGNTLMTLPSAWYDPDLRSVVPTIYRAAGYDWPSTYDRANAAVVRFVAGYATTAADLHHVRQAMLLYVEASYDRDAQTYQSTMDAAHRKLDALRVL